MLTALRCFSSLATSDFALHSLLGAVSAVAAIIIAVGRSFIIILSRPRLNAAPSGFIQVGKPVAAKFADVLGRTEAWIISIVLYAVGYVILAASGGIGAYAAGTIIRSAGYAAVQILMQIIIGDVTSLKWRTFTSSLVSAPYFINGFVGSNIAADIVAESSWRWGYGMFAILFPACAIPIVGILLWSQIKAYKLGVVHTTNPYEETEARIAVVNKTPLLKRVYAFLDQMDIVGLLLFTAGWTCVSSAGRARWKCSDGQVLTMGGAWNIAYSCSSL